MKKETPVISFVEYRNATDDEVATVLFKRYDGSHTIVGYIDERHESDGTMYYALDALHRDAYPPERDMVMIKKKYEDDEWNIRIAVNQLDKAMDLGETNERSRQEQLRATRSSKSQGKSRTK